MAKQMNKSGKHKVMKVGRDGKRRAYWVGQGPNAQRKGGLRNAGPEGAKPGFLARHGKKIAAGVALAGAAYALHRSGALKAGGGLHNMASEMHRAAKPALGLAARGLKHAEKKFDHAEDRFGDALEHGHNFVKRMAGGARQSLRSGHKPEAPARQVHTENHSEGPHVFGGSGNFGGSAWGAGTPEKKKSFGRRMLEGARNSLRRSKA